MKYVVLGANGQLGRDLCPRLPGEVVALTRAELDLTASFESMFTTLAALRPDVLINCAAYNFVDRAETEAELSTRVNMKGPLFLAHLCKQLNLVLVHFSTDHVFGDDSSRATPYRETDPPGPVSAYGMHKALGEYVVQSHCPRHLVIRTCGLYGVWGSGGKGGNFVETMLRKASQGEPLRVVADQVCTPSYTVDVAQATIALLQTGKYGLFHITNSGSCSWYEFAQAIFELSGVKANLAPITSAEYGAAARRPAYSVLSNEAYERLGLPKLRHWREALAAYLQERAQRRH